MIRPLAIALATGALCAALPAASSARAADADGHPGFRDKPEGAPWLPPPKQPSVQEEQAPAEHVVELPRCSLGQATAEGDLLAALEAAGLRLESAHARPGGGVELTYVGDGHWVRLLGDGGLACALAAGHDEETGA